jgi:hypothetical protein
MDRLDSSQGWRPRSGVAAAVGALLWLAAPWFRAAALGTRPYVGTVFDVPALAGWGLMLVGLAGVRAAFGDRYGRLGRISVGTAAVGMSIVAGLLLRSAAAFVAAGFRPVPATGEDPAGLVLTFAAFLGCGLTVAGAGGIGFALRRLDDRPAATATAGLLLLAPAVPLVAIALRALSLLPVRVGRLLVGTNLALAPLGIAWVALGALVWSHTDR